MADYLIRAAKFVLTEPGHPKKIVSDASMNFTSENSKQYCRQLNIEQAITSSYHHWSNEQVES